MASGIIALLLQINPSLSPDRIKKILNETAIRDSYTGVNPNPFTWGAGKINAYGAVKAALQTVGLSAIDEVTKTPIKIYPNPSRGEFTVDLNSERKCEASIEVVNALGQVVYRDNTSLQVGENTINLQLGLQQGLYWLVVNYENQQQVVKVMIQ